MRVLVQFRSSPQVHAALLAGESMPAFAAAEGAGGEGAAGLVGPAGPPSETTRTWPGCSR
jgi:hypothetical protein